MTRSRRHWLAGAVWPAIGLVTLGCAALPQPSAEPPPLQPASDADQTDPPPTADPLAVDLVPAPACQGYVALTFDDGPSPTTDRLLELLDRADLSATFFNIGRNMANFPEAVLAQAAAGHQFGNHTYDHEDLLALDAVGVTEQLVSVGALQRDLVGEDFEFFRPPFGNTSEAIRAEAERAGMAEALWTVDSKDFEATSAEQIVEASMGMEDGGILLLHDFPPLTLEALPHVINHYHERGLCFGRIASVDRTQRADTGAEFSVAAVGP